jgi:hypothetical protein
MIGSKRRANRFLASLAAVAALTIALWQTASAIPGKGTAGSGKAPPESSVTETGTQPQPGAADDSAVQPSDDDSEGHETEDPVAPDHATGTVAQVDLVGEDLITLGRSHAQTEDDGHSSGDVTVLAIGGNEIVGAHSDSEGETEDRVDPLAPLCEGSGGSVCIQLLFASTSSTENHSEAHTALVFVCVGGSNPQPNAECDGVVMAGVSESHAQTTTDPNTGGTSSDGEATLADVCLGGEDPATGVCTGLGANVAHSESHAAAESETGEGTASRRSVIAVEAGGDEVIAISDPTAVTIPPGCPTGPGSLLCLFLNQGESNTSTAFASAAQEAVHIDVLKSGDTTVVLGHVGASEALATAGPPAECPPICPPRPVPPGPEPGGPGPLPVTGTDPLMKVVVAGALVLAGAFALLLERRRVLVGA